MDPSASKCAVVRKDPTCTTEIQHETGSESIHTLSLSHMLDGCRSKVMEEALNECLHHFSAFSILNPPMCEPTCRAMYQQILMYYFKLPILQTGKYFTSVALQFRPFKVHLPTQILQTRDINCWHIETQADNKDKGQTPDVTSFSTSQLTVAFNRYCTSVRNNTA